jgi:hypothetical protein
MKFKLPFFATLAFSALGLSSCVVDPYGMPITYDPCAPYGNAPRFNAPIFAQPTTCGRPFGYAHPPVQTYYGVTYSRHISRYRQPMAPCATPSWSRVGHRFINSPPLRLTDTQPPIHHGQRLHTHPSTTFPSGGASRGDCNLPHPSTPAFPQQTHEAVPFLHAPSAQWHDGPRLES